MVVLAQVASRAAADGVAEAEDAHEPTDAAPALLVALAVGHQGVERCNQPGAPHGREHLRHARQHARCEWGVGRDAAGHVQQVADQAEACAHDDRGLPPSRVGEAPKRGAGEEGRGVAHALESTEARCANDVFVQQGVRDRTEEAVPEHVEKRDGVCYANHGGRLGGRFDVGCKQRAVCHGVVHVARLTQTARARQRCYARHFADRSTFLDLPREVWGGKKSEPRRP